MGKPTKPAALALKARVLLLAASPLFNGNPDYAQIVDNRGVKLFSQVYDREKWHAAADAAKEAIDVAHEAGHALFDFRPKNFAATLSYRSEERRIGKECVRTCSTRWSSE